MTVAGQRAVCVSSFYALRPKNVKLHDTAKLINCVCEQCANIDQVGQALIKILKRINCKQCEETRSKLIDCTSMANATLCQYEKFPALPCVNRTCHQCGVSNLTLAIEHLTTHNIETIDWFRWKKIVNRY